MHREPLSCFLYSLLPRAMSGVSGAAWESLLFGGSDATLSGTGTGLTSGRSPRRPVSATFGPPHGRPSPSRRTASASSVPVPPADAVGLRGGKSRSVAASRLPSTDAATAATYHTGGSARHAGGRAVAPRSDAAMTGRTSRSASTSSDRHSTLGRHGRSSISPTFAAGVPAAIPSSHQRSSQRPDADPDIGLLPDESGTSLQGGNDVFSSASSSAHSSPPKPAGVRATWDDGAITNASAYVDQSLETLGLPAPRVASGDCSPGSDAPFSSRSVLNLQE